jgi:hypothetical protein
MPIYRCPITGQTGYFNIGRKSFYDWAVEYFGEFHSYDDTDLLPMPCHLVFVQAGRPKTHVEFVEWCVKTGNLYWILPHIESNKVGGIKEIFNNAMAKKKSANPLVTNTKVSAFKSEISEEDLDKAKKNIAKIRKKVTKSAKSAKRSEAAKRAWVRRKRKK